MFVPAIRVGWGVSPGLGKGGGLPGMGGGGGGPCCRTDGLPLTCADIGTPDPGKEAPESKERINNIQIKRKEIQ